MVKFAEIQKDQVVQLGRFNKSMSEHSYKVGMVESKEIAKIGKNVYTGIVVRVGQNEKILVALHNIKDILA